MAFDPFSECERLRRELEEANGRAAAEKRIADAACQRLDELAKQQAPVAWFVRRNAPGRRDDGMRLGPFWKRKDAEEWTDDTHTLHELYLHPAPTPPAQGHGEDRKDAERYRWLRDMPDKGRKEKLEDSLFVMRGSAPKEIDAAIDAAMAAGEPRHA